MTSEAGLDEVQLSFDSKTRTASIIGNKNGIRHVTTLTEYKEGRVRTTSEFNMNVGKEALIEQIKQLNQQGKKQMEIAYMLGISQSTVSNYLKK